MATLSTLIGLPVSIPLGAVSRQGLSKLEERHKEKYKKYTKILGRLTWLNTCSSGLSMASGL